MNIDTAYIRGLLDIPAYAPAFVGEVTRTPDRLFADAECDECEHAAAVHIEYTVDEPYEGYIATDNTFCVEHAGSGVRCILDREDRSIDHGADVTVNYWAIRYETFPAAAIERAA